jgi:hypothetical protein
MQDWPTATQNVEDAPKGSATQQLPSVQRLPPQQGTRVPAAPAVPHFTHRASPLRELQTVSAPLQRAPVPGQQSSPGPPQAWHTPSPVVVLCKHPTPASVQRWPGQHGAPRPPHLTQVPARPGRAVQAASGSVQRVSRPGVIVLVGQQGSLNRPQPQRPPAHMPNDISPMRQVSPAALHWPCRQQLSPLHFMPGQHGSPGPPQRWQRFACAAHTVPAAHTGVGRLAGQQTSPAPPQVPQRPALHVWPGS